MAASDAPSLRVTVRLLSSPVASKDVASHPLASISGNAAALGYPLTLRVGQRVMDHKRMNVKVALDRRTRIVLQCGDTVLAEARVELACEQQGPDMKNWQRKKGQKLKSLYSRPYLDATATSRKHASLLTEEEVADAYGLAEACLRPLQTTGKLKVKREVTVKQGKGAAPAPVEEEQAPPDPAAACASEPLIGAPGTVLDVQLVPERVFHTTVGEMRKNLIYRDTHVLKPGPLSALAAAAVAQPSAPAVAAAGGAAAAPLPRNVPVERLTRPTLYVNPVTGEEGYDSGSDLEPPNSSATIMNNFFTVKPKTGAIDDKMPVTMFAVDVTFLLRINLPLAAQNDVTFAHRLDATGGSGSLWHEQSVRTATGNLRLLQPEDPVTGWA